MKIIQILGPNEFVSNGNSDRTSLGRLFLDSLEFSMNISNILAVVFKDPVFCFCHNDFVRCLKTGGSPWIQYIPVIKGQKQMVS